MSALTGATAGSVPCAKRRSLLQEHKLGLGLSRVLYVHSDALRGPDFEVPSNRCQQWHTTIVMAHGRSMTPLFCNNVFGSREFCQSPKLLTLQALVAS